jgi:ABC-type dipeptide/oligopeptide/nickel transport system permease component
MFRFALRRVLWSIPTLLATSLVLFFVTSLAPDPEVSAGMNAARAAAENPALEEVRRARFLDLPAFLNLKPSDVRSRARDSIAHVSEADPLQDEGAHELVRLGAAALPYVLPQLETLGPEARRRVAAALVPVAERMALVTPGELAGPEAAALFWTRLWDDRALDFARPAVRRAVTRLREHGGETREADVMRLDTLALPDLIRSLRVTKDVASLVSLTRVTSHVAGRGRVLPTDATQDEARRAVADWTEWWFVHGADFIALEGGFAATAIVTETRYGKWLRRIVSGELGVSIIDGEAVTKKLLSRAPVTLLVCALATLVSWALAVPIGAFGAWRRGSSFDVASSAVMFVLYAAPTFALAEVLRRVAAPAPPGRAQIALAVTALAAGSLATLSRWQRTAMLDVVGQEFVRTAKAKGMPSWRVAIVHALRNALMPTVTVAGLHFPVLLGSALVVEEVFGLPGVGFETMRAIESRDAPWLMAVLLAAAILVTLGLVASDVAYGLLDPRVRELLGAREGRAGA